MPRLRGPPALSGHQHRGGTGVPWVLPWRKSIHEPESLLGDRLCQTPDKVVSGAESYRRSLTNYSTRTEVSSEIISSMRSRSGIHGASLIMRTCEMIGVRSGKVLVGSGRRMSALTRTSCGKPCDTMP